MEFWSFAINEGGDRPAAEVYEHLLEQAGIAEEAGLDGVWLAEHHSDRGYSVTPSPNLLLAIIADRTERLRLGTMCTIVPYQHPLRIAEELRMLDVLSGGRLELGWGRGAIPHEQVAYGVARSETQAMFDAGIEVVHRLLDEKDVVYATEWWKGGPATAVPEAVQTPRPREWLTAVSKTSLDRAAQRGMNAITAFFPESIRRADIERYRQAWADARPDEPVGMFGVNAHVVVAETRDEALRFAHGMVDGWLGFFAQIAAARDSSAAQDDPSYAEHGSFTDMAANWSFDELIEHNVILFGDVDDVVEQAERMRDSGIEMLTGWFQFGDLDYEFSNRSLRLFCEEVLPRVRSKALA
jgi:alkanesulfonate monooxygenase SsuD/methylene tetrahydromethanopterin reductase-like flavin-dependent oxidoreductase (luciferase family)